VIAIAAKAKYAGLKGDIGVCSIENRSRGQKCDSGFPARSALVRRLARKKAVFRGRFADPFAKLIVTRPACVALNQLKTK
jgi:hypothetical protein